MRGSWARKALRARCCTDALGRTASSWKRFRGQRSKPCSPAHLWPARLRHPQDDSRSPGPMKGLPRKALSSMRKREAGFGLQGPWALLWAILRLSALSRATLNQSHSTLDFWPTILTCAPALFQQIFARGPESVLSGFQGNQGRHGAFRTVEKAVGAQYPKRVGISVALETPLCSCEQAGSPVPLCRLSHLCLSVHLLFDIYFHCRADDHLLSPKRFRLVPCQSWRAPWEELREILPELRQHASWSSLCAPQSQIHLVIWPVSASAWRIQHHCQSRGIAYAGTVASHGQEERMQPLREVPQDPSLRALKGQCQEWMHGLLDTAWQWRKRHRGHRGMHCLAPA